MLWQLWRLLSQQIKTLTNLSKSLLEQSAHRLKPLSTSIKSKVDNIVLHAYNAGTKTDALCDELFEVNGYVNYDSKIGSNNGFDGVYIKKDANGNVQEILINEAKQVGSGGNIKLSPANPSTGLNAHMSDGWINNIIDKMADAGGSLSSLASILNANKSKITKTVTGVERTSGEIIIVKLKNY